MIDLAYELDGIPGVRGFAAFDGGFRCLAHQLPPPLDASTLVQTLLQLQTAFDSFTMAHGELQQGSVMTFVAECPQGSLALRRIGAYQIVAFLRAGSDPTPLVEALEDLSARIEAEGDAARTLEESFDHLDGEDSHGSGSSLEFYSASMERPSLTDELEEPSEPGKRKDTESIWTTDVREIVGKLGKKKDRG